MSERERDGGAPDEPEPKGPNLVLYFGLVAFALIAAIACAIMIVLPFYKSRH